MEPKVSIILPVYNTAEYLPQCLDSILGQTLAEFELICVDDGSTDASPDILSEYSKRDGRISVYRQENQGAGVARNLGLSHARGKYLSFLDADDFFAPAMLEKTYARCEKTQADIVGFRSIFYNDRTGKEEGKPRGIHDEFLPEKAVFNRADLPLTIVPLMNDVVSNKFFLRAFAEAEGLHFLPLRATNDHYFCCLAMCCARRISIVDEVFYYHRQGQDNNTRMRKYLTPLAFWDSWQAARQTLIEKGLYPELERAMLNDLLKKGINQVHFFLRQGQFEACREAYQRLREEILPELALAERGEDYYIYPEKYQEACMIQEAGFDAFLFEECAGAARKKEEQRAKLQAQIQKVKKSKDYQLGRRMLRPVRALKRIFGKQGTKK